MFLTMFFFYQKSLVLWPKMVLPLKYMLLAAIYIVVNMLVINVSLVYKITFTLALFSILLFKS